MQVWIPRASQNRYELEYSADMSWNFLFGLLTRPRWVTGQFEWQNICKGTKGEMMPTWSIKEWCFFAGALELRTIFLGLGAMNDQARPHLAVWPCTNSVVFTTEAPAARTFEINNFKFAFLPIIDVNHLNNKITKPSYRWIQKHNTHYHSEKSFELPERVLKGNTIFIDLCN